jgi:hypothetical protein
MTTPSSPPIDNRSPEEIAAGNRRALLGCGSILLVMLLLFVGLVVAFRYTRGGQGISCDDTRDCRLGFACSESVFRAETSLCRQKCESNADCPSGDCMEIVGDDGGLCR